MDKHQLRDLIRKTLREVDLFSDDAVELLMLTAAVESDLGYYIKQTNGPGLGIFSIEPITHDDIMYRWLNSPTAKRKALRERIWLALSPESSYVIYPDKKVLAYDLRYSIIVARLKYYMNPEPIPSHVKDGAMALAYYWKKHFNTRFGDGSATEACDKYFKLALPIREEG